MPRKSLYQCKNLKFLGSGHIGNVYAVRDRDWNLVSAIKVFEIADISEYVQVSSGRIAEPNVDLELYGTSWVEMYSDDFPLDGDESHDLTLFLDEKRVLSKLRDLPHVVDIYSARFDNDYGRLCGVIEMEYLNGKDLMKTFKKLPEEDTAKAMADVAQGLLDLEEMKMVHRDIKPWNCIYTPGEKKGGGLCKIIDFECAIPTPTIKIDYRWGTMGYFSPEQAKKHSKLTPKSDVFSLGILSINAIHRGKNSGMPFSLLPDLKTGKKLYKRYKRMLKEFSKYNRDDQRWIMDQFVSGMGIPKDLRKAIKKALSPEPEERDARLLRDAWLRLAYR